MANSYKNRVKIDKIKVGDMVCAMVTPNDILSDGIVLYLHGGGYVAGNLDYGCGFASVLAFKCGIRVFTIEYRLAPENFNTFILTNKKLVFIATNGAHVKVLPVSNISGIRTGVGSANSFAVYVTDVSGKNEMEFLFPPSMDGSMAQKTLVMAISSLLK